MVFNYVLLKMKPVHLYLTMYFWKWNQYICILLGFFFNSNAYKCGKRYVKQQVVKCNNYREYACEIDFFFYCVDKLKSNLKNKQKWGTHH